MHDKVVESTKERMSTYVRTYTYIEPLPRVPKVRTGIRSEQRPQVEINYYAKLAIQLNVLV